MPPPSSGNPRSPTVVAVLVGVTLIAGAAVWLRTSNTTDRRACTPLQVNASLEKQVLVELADRYNGLGRSFGDGGCAVVSVDLLTSGVARTALVEGWDATALGLPEPQVWSPTSSMWVDLAREEATSQDRSVVGEGPWLSLATSPVAIALPEPMAEALGWPDADFSWSDLVALTADPDGWESVGHAEWGPFILGKDNPHRSTSGLAATVASYYAATGRSSDLTVEDLDDPEVVEFVAGVESGVAHYANEALEFLTNLAAADAEGRSTSYVSAVVLQEQLVHLYNIGNPGGDPGMLEGNPDTTPTVPLAPIYPDDGTLMMDHPFVVLDSATEAQQAAAADFAAFLSEPEQQEAFGRWGFRDASGVAGPGLSASIGVGPDQELVLISPPSATMIRAILDGWDDVRKKARVLLVIDVSGSMDVDAGDGLTRLEAAKRAAIAGLDQLHPQDAVGLWSFSTEDAHPDGPFEELLPVAPLGETADELTEAIEGLDARGGTALYATVRAANDAMLADLDPERINAVVVLTDGRNEHPADNDLDRLLADLDASGLERTVRVFSIAFGEDADLDTLSLLSGASLASAYDARDPDSIEDVFVSVLSNF